MTLLAALFILAVDNLVFWRRLLDAAPLGEPGNTGFVLAVAVALVAALAFFMSLFTFRCIVKPFVIALLILASIIAYFMSTYGVVIDDTMIANTVDTDTGEAAGLFSLALVWQVLLTGVLPALVVIWVRIRPRTFWRQMLIRIVFAVVMLAVAGTAVGVKYRDFSLVLREHRGLRMLTNPVYALYSAGEYLSRSAQAADTPLKKIGEHASRTPLAKARDTRKIMLLVVGETTRAANWGLNGYDRKTTPELAKLDLLNFPDAHSCGTSTAVSVPCMFSPLTRDNYDKYQASHSENLVDVLQHAGVDVRWEENQAGGCKGVCARVPTQNMRKIKIPGVCGAHYHCLDQVFLHGLKKKIAATQGDVLIVMHTMGSHGPAYYERYPKQFAHFKPECRNNRPQECSAKQLINSYDNSVRYVDHILAALIKVLKSRSPQADTGLLYLSDHGESLGENGIYLHGFPYVLAPDEQTHIPMVAWFSKGFVADSRFNRACMDKVTHKRVGQDNLFDTVLGLMDVRAEVYDADKDLFAACRGGGKHPAPVR